MCDVQRARLVISATSTSQTQYEEGVIKEYDNDMTHAFIEENPRSPLGWWGVMLATAGPPFGTHGTEW